ncbi:MAG: hypothetical protein Q9162_000983 [Coniocarpon cinnabarinum]
MYVKGVLTSLCVIASLPLKTLAQSNVTNNGFGSTPRDRLYIDLEQAQHVVSAAIQSASTIVPENVAVVDLSGQLVAFARMDNAYLGSIDISQKKARTAVLFNGLTTAALGQMAQPGQPLQGGSHATSSILDLFSFPGANLFCYCTEIEETNGGLIVFGGGFPIYDKGHLIGGVGCSGGTVPQDEQIARAAIAGAGFTTATD